MKNKLHILILFLCVSLVSHNLNSTVKQVDTLDSLMMPIDLSPDGLSLFLQNAYNQPEYAMDFLPNNFTHFLQFLEYGKKTKQPRSYEALVMRLFGNKLKACSYVNASALSSMLGSVTPLLEPYFKVTQRGDLHILQEKVNTLLYNSFLEKFSQFKRNPNVFFNDLSQEIVQSLSKEPEHVETTIEELRKTTLVFLETAVNKLIWSPDDSIETWHSVKTISEQLATLMDCDIIANPDDLNDLYITLMERYCYFIDIASTSLPFSFYEGIKKELAIKKPMLLTMAEQDDLIETKETRFKRVLAQAENQAQQARHKELLENEVKRTAEAHGILLR